jgi:hypothetical protein
MPKMSVRRRVTKYPAGESCLTRFSSRRIIEAQPASAYEFGFDSAQCIHVEMRRCKQCLDLFVCRLPLPHFLTSEHFPVLRP